MGRSFYDVTKDFASSAVTLGDQRRQRAQQEFANAIALAQLQRQEAEAPLDRRLKEAQIAKAQYDAGGAPITAGQTPSLGTQPNVLGGGGNLQPKTYDKFGRPKSFYDPEAQLEQKRKEYAQKPMSDTASSKLSAAQQSLGNIQTVRGMATPEKFGEMKKGFEKIRVGNRLGITNPESIGGSIIRSIPVVGQLAKWGVKTNDDQKKFENNISTLVEGQLRARTGAAAPQEEIDREVSRILSSDDSLESFLSKLSNAEKFVIGISEGIRPGSTDKFKNQPEGNNTVPDWVPKDFDYESAVQAYGSPEAVLEELRKSGYVR